MRLFNSLQIAIIFAAWPFIISWIADAEFKGATAAFYAACGAYIVAFFCMVGCVYDTLGKDKWW